MMNKEYKGWKIYIEPGGSSIDYCKAYMSNDKYGKFGINRETLKTKIITTNTYSNIFGTKKEISNEETKYHEEETMKQLLDEMCAIVDLISGVEEKIRAYIEKEIVGSMTPMIYIK